jgi:hypothetical protein
VARFCSKLGKKRPVPGRSPTPNGPPKERFTIREHVLVVQDGGGGVTELVGVGPCGARRREPGRRVMLGGEMTQNPLHHSRVINHSDDPHRVLTSRTAQQLHVPDPQNQVAPSLRRALRRRRWGNALPAGWGAVRGGLPHQINLRRGQGAGPADEVAERGLEFQKVGSEGAGGLLCASRWSRSDESGAPGLWAKGSM